MKYILGQPGQTASLPPTPPPPHHTYTTVCNRYKCSNNNCQQKNLRFACAQIITEATSRVIIRVFFFLVKVCSDELVSMQCVSVRRTLIF